MNIKLLCLLAFLIISCSENKEGTSRDTLKIESKKVDKSKIDFFLYATPISFSAKTVNGSTFNSDNLKGKNFVVFIYDKSYLKKSETYDMPTELNDVYGKYNKRVDFIGIIEGFVDNEKELQDYLTNSNILFDQIDNTRSYEKRNKLDYNIFCSPANILIDTNGKVIYSSCGGGSNEELMNKLDSLTAKK